jgi:hypothetical protein
MHKTVKNLPWKGWKHDKPGYHEKNMMLKKCGSKCFLGNKVSFPICKKNTCKISRKGVYAAYIRSRQYRTKSNKYRKISLNAINLLNKIK